MGQLTRLLTKQFLCDSNVTFITCQKSR